MSTQRKAEIEKAKKECLKEFKKAFLLGHVLSRSIFDIHGRFMEPAYEDGFRAGCEYADQNPRAEVLALVEAASKCAGGCDEWQQKAVSEFKVVFVGCGECDKCNLEKALTAWRKSRGINGK